MRNKMKGIGINTFLQCNSKLPRSRLRNNIVLASAVFSVLWLSPFLSLKAMSQSTILCRAASGFSVYLKAGQPVRELLKSSYTVIMTHWWEDSNGAELLIFLPCCLIMTLEQFIIAPNNSIIVSPLLENTLFYFFLKKISSFCKVLCKKREKTTFKFIFF